MPDDSGRRGLHCVGERAGGKVQPSRRDDAGIGGRLGHPGVMNRIKGALLVFIGAIAGAALATAFLLPAATGKPSPGSASPAASASGAGAPQPSPTGTKPYCQQVTFTDVAQQRQVRFSLCGDPGVPVLEYDSPTCINDGEASPLPKNGDIYFCRHGQTAPER